MPPDKPVDLDEHRGMAAQKATEIRRRLHDDDGLAAQGRVFLLLARRKEGVEIEEQPLHRIFGR